MSMAIILRVYGQGAIVIFGVLHPRAIWEKPVVVFSESVSR